MAHINPVRIVHSAPFHVVAGRNDTVIILLPDGHRIVLTADAAVRSGGMLLRMRDMLPAGDVVKVDFGGRASQPLGKPDADTYMPSHHGPTDPSSIRQKENGRRKPASPV